MSEIYDTVILESGLINEVDSSPDFTETRLLESCSGLPAATAAEIEPNRHDDKLHITHLSTSCDITMYAGYPLNTTIEQTKSTHKRIPD